jgi:hypothetical protein
LVKRADPGRIAIKTLIVNPGVTFIIMGINYAPINVNVAHTAKVYLDGNLVTTVATTISPGGGYFTLPPLAIPPTTPGVHNLKVTLLPEKISNSHDIFVCNTNGHGCAPRLGFADDPAKRTITSFFGTTTLALGQEHILIGGGFPVAAGPDPIAPNATIWIDRTCFNKGSGCVEKGTKLGEAQVYHDPDIKGFGSFRFRTGLIILKKYLGPNSPHHIQAYVGKNEGEIAFNVQ